MQFEPKQESDLKPRGPWPKGKYAFQVMAAEDKISKSGGNQMIELTVAIFSQHGEKTVRDWLVSTPGMAFKIRHFAYAVGMGEKYEQGSFNAYDCVTRQGYCLLDIEEGDEQYGPKNKIDDYVPAGIDPKTAPAKIESPRPQKAAFVPPAADPAMVLKDSDIPFDLAP